MEETEVDLKVPHDPISQIEAIEHYRATGKRQRRLINTRNILFIMSGAFTELEEIIRKRVQKQAIGSQCANDVVGAVETASRVGDHITGFDPIAPNGVSRINIVAVPR